MTFVEEKLIISSIFHFWNNNTIYVSRDILRAFDFHTTLGSAIGYTLVIAHEFGHSIQQQISAMMTAAEAEDNADFIAWYTMRVLEERWLLWDEDMKNALLTFADLWVNYMAWKVRIHGNSEQRKINIMRGYLSTKEWVKNEYSQYIPQIALLERFMFIEEKNSLKKLLH